jgi:hypothetical protein
MRVGLRCDRERTRGRCCPHPPREAPPLPPVRSAHGGRLDQVDVSRTSLRPLESKGPLVKAAGGLEAARREGESRGHGAHACASGFARFARAIAALGVVSVPSSGWAYMEVFNPSRSPNRAGSARGECKRHADAYVAATACGSVSQRAPEPPVRQLWTTLGGQPSTAVGILRRRGALRPVGQNAPLRTRDSGANARSIVAGSLCGPRKDLALTNTGLTCSVRSGVRAFSRP